MLNLREAQVPDFPEANLDPGVNKFLRQYGLRYEEVGDEPVGFYFMLGLSPRGGQHAVIGENGKCIFDPHPMDGTGRGLKRVARYGVLTPLREREKGKDSREDRWTMEQILNTLGIGIREFMRRTEAQKKNLLRTACEKLERGTAKDALVGRRLHTAAMAYAYTHRSIVDLVNEASELLGRARLDDDPAAWKSKMDSMRKALAASEQAARTGDYTIAIQKQEGAFTMAHMVIDKMRNSGGRARDGLLPLPPTDEGRVAYKAGLTDKLRRMLAGEYIRGMQPNDLEDVREQLRRLEKAGVKDADLRIGVTKCQQCGTKLNGDDVAEIGRKVVCPECADARVRATDSAKRQRLHRALDAVMDSQNAHVGMLGVNTEKAKALKRQLERKGYMYRFPAEPPKEDMVRHAFRKGLVGEGEWKILNERKNGFHNITEMR
jgi:predicted Zn-ribbon and HTH transcriptional regulator